MQGVSAVLLHAQDNVICLLREHVVGEKPVLFTEESGFTEGPPLLAGVTLGHKVARHDIAKSEKVIKYGVSIGVATQPIVAGEHVCPSLL